MIPRERADSFDEAAREIMDELHYKRAEMTVEEYMHRSVQAQLNIQLALKNAVEELAEQQRIATLVQLAKLTGDEDGPHEELVEAAYGALSALVTTVTEPGGGHAGPIERVVLQPQIAKVLGVKP